MKKGKQKFYGKTGVGKSIFPANNKKVLMGKGKEYSEVSKEVETNFSNWLAASNISEQELLSLIDRNDFHLTFWSDENAAITVLHKHDGEVGMPLIWQKDSGIDYESYRTDVGLLLMLIESKCKNESSKQKIKKFVRDDLLNK